MAAENKVRIKVQWDNKPWYFVRMEDDRRPLVAPFEEINKSLLMSREAAVSRCRLLKASGWDASIVTPSGVTLFQDVTAPATAEGPAPERGPMRAGDVLIVPGNPPRNGYFVRFPGTEFESLWGVTADEAYQRLLDHPLSADLIKVAEKYIVPEPPIVDPGEIQRSLQFERHGRIRRPDLG